MYMWQLSELRIVIYILAVDTTTWCLPAVHLLLYTRS